jgi:hypothetical protein
LLLTCRHDPEEVQVVDKRCKAAAAAAAAEISKSLLCHTLPACGCILDLNVNNLQWQLALETKHKTEE